MIPVTIDLADLKALVHATAAIKVIENQISAVHRDPGVQQHPLLGDAHDRLASAMRNAERSASGTLVSWDAPLTKEEVNALRYVKQGCDEKRRGGLSVFVISGPDKAPGTKIEISVYDQLAAKGCIEMGQFIQGVMWSGASSPQFTADAERGYAARPTARGLQKLADIDQTKAGE
jgi:hypothetical protein